jgi:hypothetical protein
MLTYVAEEVRSIVELDVQLAIVVGGGNIFRGVAASSFGMERTSADHMGMLATVLNSLALQDALEKKGIQTRVQTAISMHEVAEPYILRRAIAASGKRAGRYFCRRVRESLFYHRYGGGPACQGNSCGDPAQGHQGERIVRFRSGAQ